jgi:hypothetical protein
MAVLLAARARPRLVAELRAVLGPAQVVREGTRRGVSAATSRYCMSLASSHMHTHTTHDTPAAAIVISIYTPHHDRRRYTPPTYIQVCDKESHALFFPTQQHVVGPMRAPTPVAGDSLTSTVCARPSFATPSSTLRKKLSEHPARYMCSDNTVACDARAASADATATSNAPSRAAKYGAAVSIGLLDSAEGADFLSFRSLWSAQGLQDEVICT